MSCARILDYCITQEAWEPVRVEDSAGADLAFRAAAVRFGGTDTGELLHVDSTGRIYETETADTEDNTVDIPFLATTKKYDTGAVSMIHSVYLRLDGVSDTATLTVTVGGSEYGEISQSYPLDFSGTAGAEKEERVRTHRELLGRWVQCSIAGDFDAAPAIREWEVRCVPVRTGRVSQ